jgi:hypothetical protein
LLLALVVLVFLVGGLLFWRPWQPAPPVVEPVPKPVPPGTAPVAAPLKGDLDIVVYESARPGGEFEPTGRRQGVRLWELRALPLRPQDWIRIEASSDPPAHLYVVWIDATGVAFPLWPWRSPDPGRPARWTDPREDDRPRRSLKLPADFQAGTDIMPLSEDPTGVVALLLLARDKPLSDDDSAELARLLAPRRRKPLKEMELAVWLENGERVTNVKNRAPIIAAGQESGDAEPQVRDVMRKIHERFGYVRGVCFGNQGKTQP